MGKESRTDPTTGDGDLVSLSLGEDGANAFCKLVDRYKGMIMVRLMTILKDYHEAEDVAQEVFLKAYKSLHQLKDPQRFSSWLTTIAVNMGRRGASRVKPVSLDSQGPFFEPARIPNAEPVDPSASLSRKETQEHVLGAMAALPEAYRGTVHLRLVKGHTCREIAEIEGVSVGVVTSRLSRACEMLRKQLSPLLGKGGS